MRAATTADLDQVRALFREYERWLDYDLCFQGFEAELAGLPGRYAPPSGRLLLADHGGKLAGCVGLRALDEGVCEMKRLYVRDFAKRKGLGRELAHRVVGEARAIGYGAMRLDTLRIDKMRPASALYESMGFRDIEPYYDNPLPETRYMELVL